MNSNSVASIIKHSS